MSTANPTITPEDALDQLYTAIGAQVNLNKDGRDQLRSWMYLERNGSGLVHSEVLATQDGQRLWPMLVRKLEKLDLKKIQGEAAEFGGPQVRELEVEMQSGSKYCEDTDG